MYKVFRGHILIHWPYVVPKHWHWCSQKRRPDRRMQPLAAWVVASLLATIWAMGFPLCVWAVSRRAPFEYQTLEEARALWDVTAEQIALAACGVASISLVLTEMQRRLELATSEMFDVASSMHGPDSRLVSGGQGESQGNVGTETQTHRSESSRLALTETPKDGCAELRAATRQDRTRSRTYKEPSMNARPNNDDYDAVNDEEGVRDKLLQDCERRTARKSSSRAGTEHGCRDQHRAMGKTGPAPRTSGAFTEAPKDGCAELRAATRQDLTGSSTRKRHSINARPNEADYDVVDDEEGVASLRLFARWQKEKRGKSRQDRERMWQWRNKSLFVMSEMLEARMAAEDALRESQCTMSGSLERRGVYRLQS